MRDSTRRQFLRASGIVSIIGLAGCSQITGEEGIKDTDGDGVIDSEDYAPRDASVQRAEQVEEAGSSGTSTEEPTDQPTEQTATETPTVPSDAGGWTMFQHDLRNSGTTQDNAGPTANVAPAWTYAAGSAVEVAPAVVDGTVYAGSYDNGVVAVSAADGSENWRFDEPTLTLSSPAIVGGSLYIGSEQGTVFALSTSDGRERWRYETGDEVWSSPAVHDGKVYVGSYDGTMYALSTDGGIRSISTVVRRCPPSSALGTSLLQRLTLFISDPSCQSRLTG